MRRRIWIVAVALALVGCGTNAARGDGHPHGTSGSHGRTMSCGPARARTLARDGRARIYVERRIVFGCADRGAHRYRLGGTGFCVRNAVVSQAHLAGTMAGYALTSCGVDTGSTIVVVRDLASGRPVASHAATTRTGVEGHQQLDALVLRPDGAVAWIATGHAIGPPHFLREVSRIAGGRFSVLASGAGIAPTSLRLSGTTLSWRYGTRLRHAVLR